ncbi:hypothetical protein C6500_21365 [Candidatus Poribacteria bacterium]|nr:MAG: hypothetical protein C6500_21365 [Candidatus Poribacteria bacterium]
MELDLQLTPRSRILLGILGGVLLILLAIQVGPAFYRLFVNHDTQAKQEQLLQTQNLVRVAEVLKPIESEIYEETGLTLALNQQGGTNSQPAKTLFDTELPETVIRSRIDALVRRAGIQQNYQLLTKPGTAKHTHKLTAQNRGNLVLYLYFKHIETEEMELTETVEQQAEEDTFNMLMDAWLSGTESGTGEKTSKTEDSRSGTGSVAKETEPAAEVKSTDLMDAAVQWKFSSLPDTIPLNVRIRLTAFIRSMITRQLRGATDSRQDFFETQLHRVKTPATPGIFGIGAKPATVEIQLRRDSALLKILTYSEASVDIGELQYALVKYIEEIQEQRATLLKQLALAPLTYQTEHYTVEMKFKTDLEKLVNLNHLIETGAKWLTVRDLRISADKQTEAHPAARGRDSGGGTHLNVDMLLIARIF